mmetsp:Transcript_13335/g.25151  ORF Transcript_13335/g.25151 Transcript_13335/m.25151 type:complete len:581 (-) Transcript_13335:83-1825(-)
MGCSSQIFVLDSAALVILLALIGTVPCTAGPYAQKFRGHSPALEQPAAGVSINTTLGTILSSGNGVSSTHLAKISAGLQHIFQALPKNDKGRLTPRALRHIVHTYFAREHGWLIRGLEPHGMSASYSKLHEADILVDNIPGLATALADKNQCDIGFSFDDSVALTAALERAILDESLDMLDIAYKLNGFSVQDKLTEFALHSVLTSYLLIYESGAEMKNTSMEVHQAFKKQAEKSVDSWPWIVDFERDSVFNFMYEQRHRSNPFKSWEFSFQSVTRIVDVMTKKYGKWQNRECSEMKDVLVGITGDASGKVPLGRFYAGQPNGENTFSFSETEDDLREMGALENSVRGLLVRIPNYLAGPSNCIAASSYYSVCCLNECELLMHELEDKIEASSAPSEALLAVVGNMSSSTVDAPRNLSQDLQARLDEISARHKGQVPIYGRLFAEWLHHAFPNECQYPHMAAGAAELAPQRWQGSQGLSVAASEQDKQKHIQVSAGLEHVTEVAAVEWLDDEVLLLEEPGGGVSWWQQAVWRMILAAVAQVAVFVTMWSLAKGMWQQAAAGISIWQGHDKEPLEDLMFHI